MVEHEGISKPLLSPARLAVNRRNAKESTGPKTKAGKRRVALNARRLAPPVMEWQLEPGGEARVAQTPAVASAAFSFKFSRLPSGKPSRLNDGPTSPTAKEPIRTKQLFSGVVTKVCSKYSYYLIEYQSGRPWQGCMAVA
ncbi:MAG: hypothetical protein ACLQOO_34735 [Terriglobia bacterium]